MRDRARAFLGRLRPRRGPEGVGLDLPTSEPVRPLTPREAYLVRVAADLPFDESERNEVLEELAAHLADSTAQLSATGLTLDEAERQALDRLGPPDRLADDLAKARRSTRRLLAAAGAGTWAATGGLVVGWLAGFFVVLALTFALLLPLMGLAAFLHWEPVSLSGDGWNTAETLLVLGVALSVASGRFTSALAIRGGYRFEDVRRVVAPLGALVLLPWALFIWSGSLSWPGLVVLVSLPAWFAVGSWRARAPERRPRWHAWAWAAGGVAAVVAVLGLAAFMAPMGTGVIHGGSDEAQGGAAPSWPWARIGAEPSDRSFGGAVQVNDDAYAQRGAYTVTIREQADHPLAGWSDLRAEAWPGVGWPSGDQLPQCVDPHVSAPFAVAPLAASSSAAGTGGPVSFAGSVRYDTAPGLDYACLATTGVGPDGVRYLLGGPQTVQTAFRGTAWDFLAAVAAGR